MADSENVKPFPQPPPDRGGGGNGDDSRLRALEVNMARVQERLENIKQNMAVRKDISDLKVWILLGVLSATVIAASIAATVVKAFFS